MKPETYYDKKIDGLSNPCARRFKRPQIPPKESVKNIHISAVCGKAMAPLAGLLTDRGFNVTGSDKQYSPPMSELLSRLSIKENSFSADNVRDADVVVIGNSLGPDNEECAAVRGSGTPYLSVAEALYNYVLGDQETMAVAGTHGKTTTTGLLSKIFEDAGRSPGYLIGGVVQGEDKAYSVGDGDIFIIEGDEYDTAYFDKRPKFLHYRAKGLIVTSLELDHTDIFKDKEDYLQAFKYLVEDVPTSGVIFLCADNESTGLKKYTKAEVISYGFSENSDLRITNQGSGGAFQKFTLTLKGKELGEVSTPLTGDYNICNIAGAIGLALQKGISFSSCLKTVKNFHGMKKRQEFLAESDDNILLIDDYAHHPTAVEATLNGLRDRYGKSRRLVAVFEPRSNSSRRKDFENMYPASFSSSDMVVLKAPLFRHNDSADNFMNMDKIISEIQGAGINAEYFDDNNEIINYLEQNTMPGDVLITMSNGSFGNIQKDIIETFKMKSF